MNIVETNLKGCFVIEPNVYLDRRGSFYESYNKLKLEKKLGKEINFVQDNCSISKKGVLRGLHFQKGKYAQAKLISVIKGEALDVAVDLRKESPTFGKHFKIVLSGDDNKMLFIPRGMAHGFLSLSNETHFSYKCDNYYNKQSEVGIIYNDSSLKIDWNFPKNDLILSDKDLLLPNFNLLF